MPFGFRFGERDQVLFKRKYVALFWLLWNYEGEMLSFKAFHSMGNQGKRALHIRTCFFTNSIPVILQ